MWKRFLMSDFGISRFLSTQSYYLLLVFDLLDFHLHDSPMRMEYLLITYDAQKEIPKSEI